MHRRIHATFVVLPVALILLVADPTGAPASRPDEGIARLAHAAEVTRIRAHFDSVLTELPQRDVGMLTAEQRARRNALLITLRAYRDAGEFPHNYDFPGQAVPYFVDRGTGVLCAVAHLMASTGRRDIVDRVAAMNNNLWVPELANDTAFTGWLREHGLTLAEAARIQVPYIVDDAAPVSASRARGAPTGSAFAFGGAVAASLWNARANADGHSRLGNALGLIAGATALGMGANAIGGDGSAATIGAASMLAGATSAWVSTRGIMRHRQAIAAKRDAERATVAPLLLVDGKSGAGVAVTLRF